MQAAAEGVVPVVELAAGMQPGQDQLDAGDLFFRVDVHRHAAAVVADLAAAILVQGDLDAAGMPGQRLVHRVVDDFLRQMIGPGGVGIHARAALDRIQPGQDFDVFGVVTAVHGLDAFQGGDGSPEVCGWAGVFCTFSGRWGRSGLCFAQWLVPELQRAANAENPMKKRTSLILRRHRRSH